LIARRDDPRTRATGIPMDQLALPASAHPPHMSIWTARGKARKMTW
jgi:hypothetical protein